MDEASARCPACRAPLQLADEPTPSRLDRSLDLDRRRSRTPVPASAPPPAAAADDEGDLGDLSFDPPADDGPWIMASPEAGDALAARTEAAAELEAARDVLEAPGDVLPEASPEPDASRSAQLDPDPRAFAAIDSPDDPDESCASDDSSDGEDADTAVVAEDRGAAYRGRVLSLASIAIAGAAALVAVLSSR